MSKQSVTVITLISTLVVLCFMLINAVPFKESLDELLNTSPSNMLERILSQLLESVNALATKSLAIFIALLTVLCILKCIQISKCKGWLQSIVAILDFLVILPVSIIFVMTHTVAAWIAFVASWVPFFINPIYIACE